MHALVATGRVRQELVHLPPVLSARAQLSRLLAPAVRPTILVNKHAIAISAVRGATVRGAAVLLATQRTFGEVQVHVVGLHQVVVDLVEAVDGADEVRADVALLVECLEPPPDAHPLVQLELWVRIVLLLGVHPLLHVERAGPVVQPVRDVRRLRIHGAHLPHDGHLRDGVSVDQEVGAGIRFFEVKELFDRDGAQGLVGEALIGGRGGNTLDQVRNRSYIEEKGTTWWKQVCRTSCAYLLPTLSSLAAWL